MLGREQNPIWPNPLATIAREKQRETAIEKQNGEKVCRKISLTLIVMGNERNVCLAILNLMQSLMLIAYIIY